MNSLKIPDHIAIVMDGNGRWATSRNLPTGAGHLEGAKRAIFDYRESEEWVVCRPFEKLNPNAEEQMLMEIRDIVGVETMIDAIIWSEIVKEDYQIAQAKFLSKTLGKKISKKL